MCFFPLMETKLIAIIGALVLSVGLLATYGTQAFALSQSGSASASDSSTNSQTASNSASASSSGSGNGNGNGNTGSTGDNGNGNGNTHASAQSHQSISHHTKAVVKQVAVCDSRGNNGNSHEQNVPLPECTPT